MRKNVEGTDKNHTTTGKYKIILYMLKCSREVVQIFTYDIRF